MISWNHRAICLTLSLMVFLAGLAGCRGGAGSSCLSDSDCEQGLTCLHRKLDIPGHVVPYTEKWGICGQDLDEDGIPSDGDYSGSTTDQRCGVHVVRQQEGGPENIEKEVRQNCDDNCEGLANSNELRKFGCRATDDCCSIASTNPDEIAAFEAFKKTFKSYELCYEKIAVGADKCHECMTSDNSIPSFCFLGKHDVDANGCIRCQATKVEDQVSCNTVADCDHLPQVCSGSWTCSSRICKFVPVTFKDNDRDGYRQLYQLDSDDDGLGDECDNCPVTPNGIECENPFFEYRCNIDGDDVVTHEEREKGAQKNSDGDAFGDACDLCVELASNSNQDLDGDRKGDSCDGDDDGDNICDPGEVDDDCSGIDNCPNDWNPNQGDIDNDGIGDVCEYDQDDDKVREDGDGSGVAGDNPCNPNTTSCCPSPPCCTVEPCPGGSAAVICKNCDDNCPDVKNTSQLDSDGDGLGDLCDPN